METVHLDGCRIHFPEYYDERGEWEADQKGWLPGVVIEVPNCGRFPVIFFDPVRVAQDLEHLAKEGCPVLVEPGLVVIPVVTRAAILKAAPELVRQRFFDHLKPLTPVTTNGVAR
jgi:hypothetical protein